MPNNINHQYVCIGGPHHVQRGFIPDYRRVGDVVNVWRFCEEAYKADVVGTDRHEERLAAGNLGKIPAQYHIIQIMTALGTFVFLGFHEFSREQAVDQLRHEIVRVAVKNNVLA